jgi:ribosomal protein L2
LGDIIFSGDVIFHKNCFNLGSSISIKDITLFSIINNIELFPLAGSILARSAGLGVTLIGLNYKLAFIKFSSG